MNKKYKSKISFFVVVLFVTNILLGGQFSLKAQAEENAVKITKNIDKTSAVPGEEIDVTLNVKGTPQVNQVKPNDVILIVDKSGSMGGQKIEDAKNSAKAFIDLMDMTKHRVGVVDFSSVIDSKPLTNNAEEAKRYIDGIRDGGATYTGSAVRRAKELLQDCRQDAQPVIVIMTDGAANYGGSVETGFNDAKAAAKEAKDAGIVFYTIALLDSNDNAETSPQNAVLKEMATTAQHHHFVLGSVGLDAIYKSIVKEIGIASAYDVNIKDVVSPEFEIVPGSYDSNIPKPQVNGNEISWHLLELKDQELTFNYKIRARKDAKLGTYPVASESKVQYKDFTGANKTLNINKPSVTLEYPAPTITEVAPNNGEISGGNEITIKGTNFKPEAKVYFDSALGLNVRVINENEIKVIVPSASQKTATLKVVNKDNKFVTSSYLYWAKPIVTSLTPNKGPISGNTVVTIKGNNFLNGINIRFGNKPAKKVIYKNPTLIYGVTDAADAEGVIDVTLTNPDIDKSEVVIKDGFTFEGEKVLAPVVSGVTPSEGYTDEAKTVKITGQNFKDGTKVKFGDKEATNVKVESDTTITATVPTVDVPKVVDVKVINADSQEGKLENVYKYIERPIPAPEIKSIAPNEGIYNEEKKISIYASNFKPGVRVKIGDKDALETTLYNNYIDVKVPAADTPKSVDVTLINPDGKEAKVVNGYTYKPVPEKPAPTIDNVSPNWCYINQTKNICINGSNFQNGAKVYIGKVEATEVDSRRATYIYATVPVKDTPSSVDVKVVNPDGKEVALKDGFTYKPEPEKLAPTISNVNSNWCYIGESKRVSVNGANFQLGAKVYIDGVEATEVDSSHATYVYATVPVKDIAATVDVKVVNPDGKEVVLKDGFTYKDTPGPEIRSITPNEGIYNEEKKISIYASNFKQGVKVKIGDKDASEVVLYNTYIDVKIPASDVPKSVDITLINPDGKEAKVVNGYTYKPIPENPAPTIREITPNNILINSTRNVSVYGQNFQRGITVKFGDVEATNVEYISSKYISVAVPERSTEGIVDVTLTNPDGKEVVLAGGFSYIVPQMAISSLAPNHGKLEGGYLVSIYGSNFAKDSEVYVDGKKVDDIEYRSSGLIYINKMPARLTDGEVDVEVRSASLGQSKTIKFTYDPKPIIPAPQFRSYSSRFVYGELKLDIYANYLSKNMAIKIQSTGEEIVNASTSSKYVSFILPSTYRGQKVTITLINKDENKESVPYEVQLQ